MSQYPRRVLTDTEVTWDGHANGAQRATFTRRETLVDIAPGSALEVAYGGSANLSGVVPADQRGEGATFDHAAVTN